jgi:hypothetical protein
MMRLHSVLRDVALVCLAVAIGWWARGAGSPVLAQRAPSSSSSRSSSSASDADLAFQLFGSGYDSALAAYNPSNRVLYVYQHVAQGNSSVNCTYSYSIPNPGAPIQRHNCEPGDLVPQH